MLLCGLSIRPQASFYGAVLHFLGSTLCSPFVRLNRWLTPKTDQASPETAGNSLSFSKLMVYVLPLLVTGLFFILYQNGSPVFASVVARIDLSFISWEWLGFAFTGFLLLFGTFFPQVFASLTFDEKQPDQLLRSRLPRPGDWSLTVLKREFQTGRLLLVLLNLLLLLVNALDFVFLLLLPDKTAAVNATDSLHQSVNSLILSIVLAIAVMLYYFRGNLNFFSQNRPLKILAYCWIFQNALLVLLTLYKNFSYIQEGGLTHRRIGVYVYLLLTFIGLVLTFWKVLTAKSNWFLFRTNAWLFYMVLVLSTFFNWDRMIVDYNLQARFNKPQFDWLIGYAIYDLSESSLPQISLLLNDPARHLSQTDQDAILAKIDRFEKQYERLPALSWNYESQRIHQHLTQRLYLSKPNQP